MDAVEMTLPALLDACYRHAVSGELAQAEALVEQARRHRPLREGARESVEAMLVEGVVHAYQGEVDAARDRFRRVIALGTLVPADDLPELAWAWQALLDYNRGDVLAAADAVGRACARPERARPRTRLRAAVDAALLCEYAGLGGAARGWMAAARLAAGEAGIPAVVGVIAYDLAAVRLTEAVVEHLRRPTSEDAARALLLQVRSAINFDAATGSRVQAPLLDMVQAIALRLLGQVEAAIPLLERFVAQARDVAEADRWSARVELLACRMQLADGPCDPAWRAELEAALPQAMDPGECAHICRLLARWHEAAGQNVPALAWNARFEQALADHDARLLRLCDRLAALALTSVPPAWARPGASTPS